MNIKINLPERFLDSEYRCDYYVSSEMKKVWAVEIDLMCELMRVCKEHNLKLFAIAGTTLGAVRHNGMIPWDDDIDMGMTRNDYIKLQAIAEEAFTYPYFFHDENTDPGSLTGHGRIINLQTTAINRYHLNKESQGDCTFKQCIFIDIFPLDNLPDDKDECERFIEEVYKFGYGVWNESKRVNRNMNIKEPYIPHSYAEYELYGGRYNKVNTKYVSSFAYGRNNIVKSAMSLSDIGNLIEVDFEFVKILIIKNYEQYLTQVYGDWHKYVKGTSCHGKIGSTFFDTEKPCEYYLNNEENMKIVRTTLLV